MANVITAPRSATRERIGAYRVLEELGESNSVCKAEDPHSRRPVALKVFRLDAPRRESFLPEARRLMRLEHEHLVPILDAGETDDSCYLVMEFLKGETLQTRLKREHKLSLKEALRIAREIASALGFIHANSLIHRDVCPDNVWLEPSGRARLLGVKPGTVAAGASLLNRLDGPGTPGYLAPEQAAGETIALAADLFGLGGVLYQMATGERPFRGDNPTALFRAAIFDHPKSPRSINPEISESLDELITRMLAKMPADRPASAQEVEHRLMEWLDPIAPKPKPLAPSLMEPMVFPASRRILDTLDSLRDAERAAVASAPRVAILHSAEPPKPRRHWLPDLVAGLLLFAGALGLYLWWKSSNEAPPQTPAAKTAPVER